MFCLCLGLPCVFRQGFRAVLFCQNQSGGFRYGESECGGFHGFFTHWSAHLPVQYNPFRLWDDGKLKTSQSSLVCVIGCAKLTEGVVLSGSTVCSPYIMRVVCSDIATVTKAQLSAAGFLRGWCAPFASLESGVRTGFSVLSGPTGNVTVA